MPEIKGLEYPTYKKYHWEPCPSNEDPLEEFGSEISSAASSSEEGIPIYEAFGSELALTLDETRSEGAFACSGVLSKFPNPGLNVNDLGIIGLPLSDRDAKALTSKCQQSPFGKGEKTLIDLSVRKCWELASDQFSFKNTGWSTSINGLLNNIHQGLGLSCPRPNVKAELYKLLLYEEGAFFKPHQDSEKTPGMFGTLVVSLPSKHEGGTVVLSHNKQTYQYDSAGASEFESSFAAWYADVSHEVKPVTSGYRLVLTYNLVQQVSGIPQKAAASDGNSTLKSLLSSYEKAIKNDETNYPDYLIHKLEHSYTEDGLKLSSLKGKDYAQTICLRDACKEIDFDIYLAAFEKMITYQEELPDEMCERTEHFRYLVQLDGTQCSFTPHYKRSCHMQKPDDTDIEDADESDHEGYTGNAGAEDIYWYRNSVVLLVPPSRKINFAIASNNLYAAVNTILPKLRARSQSEVIARKQLRSLCERVLAYYASKSYYVMVEEKQQHLECMTSITIAALQNNWMDVFDLVPAADKLNPACYDALATHMASGDFAAYVQSLEQMIEGGTTLAKKINILTTIHEVYMKAATDDQQTAELELWFKCVLDDLLVKPGQLDKVDGDALAHIASFCDVDIQLQIMPKLKECTAQTITAFLRQYRDFAKHKTILSSTVYASCMEEGLGILWSNFEHVQPEKKPVSAPNYGLGPHFRLGQYYSFQRSEQASLEEKQKRIITRNELEDLIDMTKEYTSIPIPQILRILEDALYSVDTDYLNDELVPFTASLMGDSIVTLNGDDDPAIFDAVSSYVTAILCQYITNFVGKKPSKVANYSLPTRGCGCADCQHVDAFMADGSQKELYFAVNKRRRAHLHSYFTDHAASYSVDTLRHTTTHTWHVVKNLSGQKKTMKDWEGRVLEARNMLKTISKGDKQLLKKFLGQHFDAINKCRIEKLPLRANREPLQSVELNANGGVGSKKRSAQDKAGGEQENSTAKRSRPSFPGGVEVVDLTGP